MAVVLHIGTSRTATTTLQKTLFPKAKSNLFVTKNPYKSSIKEASPGRVRSDRQQIQEYLGYYLIHSADYNGLARDLIFPLSILATKYKTDAPDLFDALVDSIRLLLYSTKKHKNIIISSEMLSETGASISCLSNNSQGCFPLFTLAKAVESATLEPAMISVCFRDPLQHLVSKYQRCCIQRSMIKHRPLSANEYIQKQISLHRSCKNSSAISTVLHRQFLKELGSIAFVKSFGFEQLKKNNDVFQLIGAPSEEKIAFSSLPVENKFHEHPKIKKQISLEIKKALIEEDYLNEINNDKIFE